MSARYPKKSLLAFAETLLQRAGMQTAHAESVARILLTGDLMGHTTHGLQLLGPYLDSIASGGMTTDGNFDVVNRNTVTECWDGRFLAGPWLVEQAFDRACSLADQHGSGSISIRNSHHIACLAAFLPAVTARNKIGLLMTSDPTNQTVAPHGGITPVYSPNPIAAGFPTPADPVILDISASSTTNGLCNRNSQQGLPLPHAWVRDNTGAVTDDPAAIFSEPPGSILPLGGVDNGHKGFALGLLVETLTSALAGFGRRDYTSVNQPDPQPWRASVFVQVIDPAGFAGIDEQQAETGTVAAMCRRSAPVSPDQPVRVPGERALSVLSEAATHGVALYPGIMEGLTAHARRLDVSPPQPVSD